MKKGLRNLAASIVLASVAGMSVFAGAQSMPSTQRFDLTLDGAELMSALNMLSSMTGLEYVMEPSDSEFRLIHLNLVGKTRDEALQAIVTAAGAEAALDPSGFYVIRAKGANQEEPIAVPTPEVKKPVVVESIKLMKADPIDVITLLAGREVDPTQPFRRLSTWTREVTGNNGGARQFSTPLTVVDQGTTLNPFPEANGNSGVQLPGERSNQIGPGGGGGLGGGQPGGGGGLGQPGGGGGLGTGQGGTGLTGGDGFIPEGIEQISYNPTDNSIIVQGPEEDIRELERLIQQFDVAPKQVVVEVEFITTTNNDNRSLGIDWLYQRGATFAGVRPGSFARQSDPVFINYATGNISTRLRTLLTNDYGRTVNAPLVRTLNNTPATVFQTTTTTIFVNNIASTGGAITIVSNPVQLPITTLLAVTPRINNDGTITMYLTPQIADFGALQRGPDGQEIPDTVQQGVQVVARVKDGETVALGGFTRKQDVYSVSKIPVLSELPIIGQLFRTRNSQERSSELIIFVTPTIVDEDDYGLTP